MAMELSQTNKGDKPVNKSFQTKKTEKSESKSSQTIENIEKVDAEVQTEPYQQNASPAIRKQEKKMQTNETKESPKESPETAKTIGKESQTQSSTLTKKVQPSRADNKVQTDKLIQANRQLQTSKSEKTDRPQQTVTKPQTNLQTQTNKSADASQQIQTNRQAQIDVNKEKASSQMKKQEEIEDISRNTDCVKTQDGLTKLINSICDTMSEGNSSKQRSSDREKCLRLRNMLIEMCNLKKSCENRSKEGSYDNSKYSDEITNLQHRIDELEKKLEDKHAKPYKEFAEKDKPMHKNIENAVLRRLYKDHPLIYKIEKHLEQCIFDTSVQSQRPHTDEEISKENAIQKGFSLLNILSSLNDSGAVFSKDAYENEAIKEKSKRSNCQDPRFHKSRVTISRFTSSEEVNGPMQIFHKVRSFPKVTPLSTIYDESSVDIFNTTFEDNVSTRKTSICSSTCFTSSTVAERESHIDISSEDSKLTSKYDSSDIFEDHSNPSNSKLKIIHEECVIPQNNLTEKLPDHSVVDFLEKETNFSIKKLKQKFLSILKSFKLYKFEHVNPSTAQSLSVHDLQCVNKENEGKVVSNEIPKLASKVNCSSNVKSEDNDNEMTSDESITGEMESTSECATLSATTTNETECSVHTDLLSTNSSNQITSTVCDSQSIIHEVQKDTHAEITYAENKLCEFKVTTNDPFLDTKKINPEEKFEVITYIRKQRIKLKNTIKTVCKAIGCVISHSDTSQKELGGLKNFTQPIVIPMKHFSQRFGPIKKHTSYVQYASKEILKIDSVDSKGIEIRNCSLFSPDEEFNCKNSLNYASIENLDVALKSIPKQPFTKNLLQNSIEKFRYIYKDSQDGQQGKNQCSQPVINFQFTPYSQTVQITPVVKATKEDQDNKPNKNCMIHKKSNSRFEESKKALNLCAISKPQLADPSFKCKPKKISDCYYNNYFPEQSKIINTDCLNCPSSNYYYFEMKKITSIRKRSDKNVEKPSNRKSQMRFVPTTKARHNPYCVKPKRNKNYRDSIKIQHLLNPPKVFSYSSSEVSFNSGSKPFSEVCSHLPSTVWKESINRTSSSANEIPSLQYFR
ncbi:hypothetical protein FQA39_LY06442 [Lamprigera yunnana]|nr:hypothetical protein FQA39_LY06442 [Lamprigera yunnana]